MNENDKTIKKIIEKSEYYNNYYNTMKNKTLNELLEILENTLKQNVFSFKIHEKELNNLNNLSHHDKYVLFNNLNYCESIIILNYLIDKKLWKNIIKDY